MLHVHACDIFQEQQRASLRVLGQQTHLWLGFDVLLAYLFRPQETRQLVYLSKRICARDISYNKPYFMDLKSIERVRIPCHIL